MEFSRSALDLIGLLEGSGHEAWLVGGCVRDAILGRPLNDIDIATSARWEEVARICGEAGFDVRETGTRHGTVTVIAGSPADACGHGSGGHPGITESFEVTTYRTDSATSADARHPDFVEFVSSIEEDLSRRDFTVNAMAWHPERGLLDPFGGIADIEGKRIRAVGDPRRRFKEDALRILRACRFSSQLGFGIDPATYEAMVSDKHLLVYVSSERCTHELDLFLLGDFVHDALMANAEVLFVILPELVAMKDCSQVTKYHIYDVLEHTAWALQRAVKDRLVRWSVLCHDMGKPACGFFDAEGVEHFYGHAKVSAQIAQGLLSRFMLSRKFRADVVKLVSVHSDHGKASEKTVRRFLSMLDGSEYLFRRMLDLNRADILAHAPEYHSETEHIDELEALLDAVLSQGPAFTVRDLAIDGDDVLSLGVRPGPMVGNLLEQALEAVIEGDVPNDRDSLRKLVESLAS